MTREQFINILIKINDEFKEYSSTLTEKVHYEILHVTITETIDAFDGNWKNIPKALRYAVERLEKLIYAQTSFEYQQARKEDLAKKQQANVVSKQVKEEPKNGVSFPKAKHKIGFDVAPAREGDKELSN